MEQDLWIIIIRRTLLFVCYTNPTQSPSYTPHAHSQWWPHSLSLGAAFLVAYYVMGSHQVLLLLLLSVLGLQHPLPARASAASKPNQQLSGCWVGYPLSSELVVGLRLGSAVEWTSEALCQVDGVSAHVLGLW